MSHVSLQILLKASASSIPYGQEWDRKRLLAHCVNGALDNTLATEMGVFDGYTHYHEGTHLVQDLQKVREEKEGERGRKREGELKEGKAKAKGR